MKFRTTQKEIKNGYYYVFSIPYCDAWHLLRGKEPKAYTAGIYGWNADIYEADNFSGVAIVTGYRPFGKAAPRELLKKYEEKAKKIYNNNNYKYDTRINKLNKLLDEFINVLVNQ
jgi:hypothetical protein